jgi:hypothetical protein
MVDRILLFACCVRDECIVCAVTVALVTVAGQSFAKRLLAPRVKQELLDVFKDMRHNRDAEDILTATTVVMVNSSKLECQTLI